MGAAWSYSFVDCPAYTLGSPPLTHFSLPPPLQAQDRCHRIGQTREVHIYRLVSDNTIEENILRKSDQKRQLDFLAIQSAGFTTDVLHVSACGGMWMAAWGWGWGRWLESTEIAKLPFPIQPYPLPFPTPAENQPPGLLRSRWRGGRGRSCLRLLWWWRGRGALGRA